MTFRNIFGESALLPLSDRLLGFSIKKDFDFLMKSQWWSREQINEYQNYNLKKLIKHAYENVPYYNELFKNLKLTPNDIKSKDDLYKIPILTKEEIRKNFPDKIVAKNLSKSQLILNKSSGSTGEALQYFGIKATLSLHKAMGIRAWYWMNYKLGDKYIKISIRPRNSILKKTQDFMNNCKYFCFEELAENIFLKMIEKIESVDPKIIRCYPVPFYYMAQVIEKRGGINLSNLVAVSTTGSTLHPYMREKIQEIFKVNIYDSYSCEGGSVFAQCGLLDNYHPSEEYAISEFIEDDFSKNDNDHAKRHITTDLFNYATPFIRYDTQDYIVLGDDKKCSCGRNFINIVNIKGRDSDIIYLQNGRYMLEFHFYMYFDSFDAALSINQYQIYQEKINLIHIRLVVNNSFNANIKKEVYNYWRDYFGPEIELKLEIVDNIKLTPTGKRRIIIRNPEIKIR